MIVFSKTFFMRSIVILEWLRKYTIFLPLRASFFIVAPPPPEKPLNHDNLMNIID